jgi:hypothetical protein
LLLGIFSETLPFYVITIIFIISFGIEDNSWLK